MAEKLSDFMRELEETAPPPFSSPYVYFDPVADSLLFYFRNEESYARRLDNVVTLFLAYEGDKLVGCQIKGLKRKLQSDGHFGITITKDRKVQLGLFFHLLAFDVPEPGSRERLVELGQQAKDCQVDAGELLMV